MSWEVSYVLARFLDRLEQFDVGLRGAIDKFGFTKTIMIVGLGFAGAFALAPNSTFVVVCCLGFFASHAAYVRRRGPFRSGLEPITFAAFGGIVAAVFSIVVLQEVLS